MSLPGLIPFWFKTILNHTIHSKISEKCAYFKTVWVQRLVFFFILPLKLIFRQQKWPVQLHRSPSRLKPRISNPPVSKRPSDYPWKSKPVEDSVQKQDRHRDSFVIVTELSSFLRCRGGAVDSRREFPSLCFSTLYLFSGQT